MWTWLLVPPSQLPMSLVASTSVASVSGCQYHSCQCLWLPVSVASFSSCQYLSCQGLGCRVLQLPVSRLLVPKLPVPLPRYLLVPWLVSRFCAMVAEDITKPVVEDSCETIVEHTHESSAKMSYIQTLITSNNNRSGHM